MNTQDPLAGMGIDNTWPSAIKDRLREILASAHWTEAEEEDIGLHHMTWTHRDEVIHDERGTVWRSHPYTWHPAYYKVANILRAHGLKVLIQLPRNESGNICPIIEFRKAQP